MKILKNAEITPIPTNMAMDKTELIKHKESLEAELKADELALQRIKSRVDYQKKYLKLIDEQIQSFDEVKALEPKE